jgi:hypothetical protein
MLGFWLRAALSAQVLPLILAWSFLAAGGLFAFSPATEPPRAGVTDDAAVCQAYDPTKIQVVAPNQGLYASQAWKIESDGKPLEEAASRADADRVAALALFYSVECRIASTTHLIPTVTYWKEATKPLAVPFPEDCRTYDPAEISRTRNAVGDLKDISKPSLQPRFLIEVPGDKEGAAVLALARQSTTACVIGGWQPATTPDMENMARVSADARRKLEEVQNAWHPVYYWKK